MDVKIIETRNEHTQWDKLVMESPSGTIFQTTQWITAYRSPQKHLIYGVFNENELVGGCVLYVTSSMLGVFASGTQLLIPYGGIVVKSAESTKTRKQEHWYNKIIFALIDNLQSSYTSIRFDHPPFVVDMRPYIQAKWESRIYYTYWLNLNRVNSDDEIEKSMSRSTRRSVEKASDCYVWCVEPDESFEYIDLYNDLMIETYNTKKLVPPLSHEQLQTIMRFDCSELWCVKNKTGIVAMELMINDGYCAHRFSPVTANKKHAGAVALLLTEICKSYLYRGFVLINLMAANTPSLAQFISGFNPQLIPHYTVEWHSQPYNFIYSIAKTTKHLLVRK